MKIFFDEDTGREVDFDDAVALFAIENIHCAQVKWKSLEKTLSFFIELGMTETIILGIVDCHKRGDSMVPWNILPSARCHSLEKGEHLLPSNEKHPILSGSLKERPKVMSGIVVSGRTVRDDVEPLTTFVAEGPLDVRGVFELGTLKEVFEDLPLLVLVPSVELDHLVVARGGVCDKGGVGIREEDVLVPVEELFIIPDFVPPEEFVLEPPQAVAVGVAFLEEDGGAEVPQGAGEGAR